MSEETLKEKQVAPMVEKPPAERDNKDVDLEVINKLSMFHEYTCSKRVKVYIDEDSFNLARGLMLFLPQLKSQQDLIDNIIRKGLLLVAREHEEDIRKTFKRNPYDRLLREARKDIENG